MVKIRLARFGKKKQPAYRIVATNARTKRNTLALEYLGSYNPFDKKNKFQFDKERIQYWLDNGAQPTYTVKSLLIKDGFLKADIKKRPAAKKTTKTQETVEKQETKAKTKTEEKVEVEAAKTKNQEDKVKSE